MRIAIYSRTEVKQFGALGEGCQAMGHTVVWQRPSLFKPAEDVKDADAVVIHGIQRGNRDILNHYRAKGLPVWIMELPRLRDEKDAHGLYLNTVHWIPERGYRKPVEHGVIKDRPEAVLVCGQVPNDVAHGLPANEWDAWSRKTVAFAREKTGLPVIYRKHPVDKRPVPHDAYGADEVSDTDTETIYGALAKASLLVCHNSTCGWNAIDAGVPVYATARGENRPGYRDYTIESIEKITPLSAKKRAEALARVASTQWTIDEMASGATAERIFCG